jgi:hypothetical protein
MRWVVALVVVLLAVAAGAAVLLVRPDLADAADRADDRWTPLRAPLTARYQALAVVAQTLHEGGAAERAVTKELDAVLERWGRLTLKGDAHTDPVVETTVANQLEGLARRVGSNIVGSARLAYNEALSNAMAAFNQVIPNLSTIEAYNRAVRAYEDQREGAIKRLVAGLLGYDSRPQLAL